MVNIKNIILVTSINDYGNKYKCCQQKKKHSF